MKILELIDSLPSPVKALGDVLSIGALLGVLWKYLPDVSLFLTVVWFSLRIVNETLVMRKHLRDKKSD